MEEVDGKVWKKKHMEQIKQSPNARRLEENSPTLVFMIASELDCRTFVLRVCVLSRVIC